MSRTTPQVDPLSAARLTLTGRVQGIGMRPAVARFAQQLGLNGWARNTRHGLEIHLEGTAWGVERFQKEFSHHLPVAARITSLHIASAQPAGHARFVLGGEETLAIDRIATDAIRMEQPLRAAVPPDVVVCDHCLSDVRSTDNRRHGYPFASCTDCGPRYSIIDRMPYERAQTGMSEFPLCDHCRREYASPGDRRFHAQTNACPKCGPSIWLQSTAGRVIARGGDAIRAAAGAILDGRIVALRGLGGYQLLADATSPQAVEQLRAKKKRPSKPLAVMVAGRREAERYAILNDAERQLLQSPAGSIVLLATSEGLHRGSICASVTAGLNTIGLMLPTTPLHSLLLDRLDRPLICTSANVEGDPLIFDSRAAAEQLPALADVVLNHNRPIRRPIDDSVVRVMAGHATAIRLARGYAPLSLEIETDRPIIALGGHLKTSVAISNGVQAVLGPHLGDLETLATRERYVEHVAELRQLYNSDDPNFVCDRHPDYFTSQWAAGQSRQVLQVNHHHAHIVAGMCEQGWLDRAVLGISFDGTGFGNDGTIWGGEILRVTVDHFQRIGMLRPFSLPGGEHAVREPWRVATALVYAAAGEDQAARLRFRDGDPKSLLPVLRRPRLSPRTSSAGRLFDGVAAIVLGIEHSEFEGQPAMLLEAACDASAHGAYDCPINSDTVKQLDWRRLVRQLLQDKSLGATPGEMAMRFHRSLADALFAFCSANRSTPVVLGGGVFQNRILVELLTERFARVNQPLGLPGMIPPNDGGLAAGQLAIAAAQLRKEAHHACA